MYLDIGTGTHSEKYLDKIIDTEKSI